jgi:hypothetical protein
MRIRTLFAQGFALLVVIVAGGPAISQQTDIAFPASLTAVRVAADPNLLSPLTSPVDTEPKADSAPSAVVRPVPANNLPDFNRNLFYKNKTEFSIETGWLPNNIPFVFDFLVGSTYTTWPLKYTLMPTLASVRWQIDNPWGWKPLRGTTEFSFSGSYTAVPRGPETRYIAFDYGIRRYFVQPRWRVVPYVEGRGGIGNIDAKGAKVYYAQGQDLTFTLMVGSGARFNFTPRYGMSAGMTYMHVSNFYLSEPQYEDFGINVYGAIVGVYMRLGKPKQSVVL